MHPQVEVDQSVTVTRMHMVPLTDFTRIPSDFALDPAILLYTVVPLPLPQCPPAKNDGMESTNNSSCVVLVRRCQNERQRECSEGPGPVDRSPTEKPETMEQPGPPPS